MTAADLTVLKEKIKSSSLLSQKEKSEWIYLLPRMNDVQVKEIEQILALNIILPPKQTHNKGASHFLSPPPFREGGEKEGVRSVGPSVIPDLIRNPVSKNNELDSRLRGNDNIVQEIEPLDYLRSLSLDTLRADGPTYDFFLVLNKKINALRQTVSGAQIEKAFEQSPLCKTYLAAGMTALEEGSQNMMTAAEFDMVADFRGELRKLLS